MTSRLGLAEGWEKIHNLRFNNDCSMFAVAERDGFRLMNVEPLREMCHFKAKSVGSIAIAEQFERSNLIALVCTALEGENRPMFDNKSVFMFDPSSKVAYSKGDPTKRRISNVDSSNEGAASTQAQSKNKTASDKPGRFMWEFTIPEKVLAVRMNRTNIVIAGRTVIKVFTFPGKCRYLFSVSTRPNPLGLLEISRSPSNTTDEPKIVVFPGYKTGSLQIVDLNTTEHTISQSPFTINAHQNDLQCIALNRDSSMVATASSKGTLIRIWSTVSRQMLVELRRGTDQAILHCINFSADDQWLCCSSDKGTVHIFALQDYKLNKRSKLATIGVPGAYAGSQWSLASFTVRQEVACICSFGKQSGTVFAICMDGSFHKYHFTAEGQCNQMQHDTFTQMCESCTWEDLQGQ